jgi:iron-sulfur cluster repair protein YtfE (RIC family)
MNGVNHCGAYLEHLQAEHHRLNCALLEIRHQFAELNRSTQPPDGLAELTKRLEDLLKELRSHFAEEEEGGCLEEAVARCPSLGPQTKDLMGEHPQLARALEQLLAAMKDRAANQEAWQKQFEAFATDLRAHECAENRLLQTALGGEAADYDVEGNE